MDAALSRFLTASTRYRNYPSDEAEKEFYDAIAGLRQPATELQTAIDDVDRCTDGWPWYWLSYGEKCYAFAVVSAFPEEDGDPIPRPGSRLDPHPTEEQTWVGINGTSMLIDQQIASIEQQNGDAICRFIAMAHAELVKPDTSR